MSEGYPKPSALKWSLAGKELSNYENEGLFSIKVKITQNWHGKTLNCYVTQTDDFVNIFDFLNHIFST